MDTLILIVDALSAISFLGLLIIILVVGFKVARLLIHGSTLLDGSDLVVEEVFKDVEDLKKQLDRIEKRQKDIYSMLSMLTRT